MKLFLSLALVVLSSSAASAFVPRPVPRAGVLTFVAADLEVGVTEVYDEEEPPKTANFEAQTAHLQKKLRYWKKAQKAKEDEYKMYLQQQMIENKSKPIYKREGKIDHYCMRPVYDKQTERIQTEIWSVKEHIKLTQAKLAEERHVHEVLEETAERLERHDAEVCELQAKAKKLEADAKAKQEMIQMRAKETMQKLQKKSTDRLTEKEQEITTLEEEIDFLSKTLQARRQELETKECTLYELEHTLETKETILHDLNRERASIRALARQSWKVFKTRFKKHILHKEVDQALSVEMRLETNAMEEAESVNGEAEANANGAAVDKELAATTI